VAFSAKGRHPVLARRNAEASLNLLGYLADMVDMPAFITVSDAAGRVLFRRPATEAEMHGAMQAAEIAQAEGRAAMERIARERVQAEWAENGDAPEALDP